MNKDLVTAGRKNPFNRKNTQKEAGSGRASQFERTEKRKTSRLTAAVAFATVPLCVSG